LNEFVKADTPDPAADGRKSFAFFFHSDIIFRVAKMDPFGEIFFHGRRFMILIPKDVNIEH
jgi:hypothetical protein